MSEQSNGLLAFLSLSALLSIVPIRSLKFSITLTTSFQLYKTKNSSAIGTAIFNFTLYLGAESNCYQKFRKLLFYPLNYRGIFICDDKDSGYRRDKQTKRQRAPLRSSVIHSETSVSTHSSRLISGKNVSAYIYRMLFVTYHFHNTLYKHCRFSASRSC